MYLMVLQLAADDAERIVDRVVVDVDLRQPLGGATGHPLFVAVVIHHDGRPRRHDRVLTATQRMTHESGLHLCVDYLTLSLTCILTVSHLHINKSTMSNSYTHESTHSTVLQL